MVCVEHSLKSEQIKGGRLTKSIYKKCMYTDRFCHLLLFLAILQLNLSLGDSSSGHLLQDRADMPHIQTRHIKLPGLQTTHNHAKIKVWY